MKRAFQIGLNSIIAGACFALGLVGISGVFASLSSGLTTSDAVTVGQTLTTSAWNKIVNSILELDSRTSSISSSGADLKVSGYGVEGFVAEAKQNNILTVQAPTWVDIPGTSTAFTLTTTKILNLRAFGSISISGGSNKTYTHCGIRFVLDGTPYGDGSWGDQIVGCDSSDSSAPTGWWCNWGIERNISNIGAGVHTAKLQMIGWEATAGSCNSTANDYSAARLFIYAR